MGTSCKYIRYRYRGDLFSPFILSRFSWGNDLCVDAAYPSKVKSAQISDSLLVERCCSKVYRDQDAVAIKMR